MVAQLTVQLGTQPTPDGHTEACVRQGSPGWLFSPSSFSWASQRAGHSQKDGTRPQHTLLLSTPLSPETSILPGTHQSNDGSWKFLTAMGRGSSSSFDPGELWTGPHSSISPSFPPPCAGLAALIPNPCPIVCQKLKLHTLDPPTQETIFKN